MATNHEVQAAGGRQVVADVYSAGTGTHKANARLIAAAPDMYEALDNLLAVLDVTIGPHHTGATLSISKARAEKALAKAEGKEIEYGQ